MYNTSGNVLGATTGVGAVATGAAVLPNTGGNLLLTVLSIATMSIGATIVISFVVSRVLASRYDK